MPETIIRSVGPGRDFETLAAFAAALPLDLVGADQVWIAELMDGAEDPGGVVIQTVCDATRHVILRAGPGQSYSDVADPDGDPLAPSAGLGAMIRTAVGDALRVQGVSTRCAVRGLQIEAEAGRALSDDGAGRFTLIERCLVWASGTGAALTVRGTGSALRSSVVIQDGAGDGIHLADGAVAESVTILKPARDVADGFGIAHSGTPAPEARASAVIGFGQAYQDGIGSADRLVSDQTNALLVPDDFADAYWTAISSTVDIADTVPGPYGVPLQRLGNNLNSFARFEAPVFASVPPGERVSFSAIVAQPSTLVSAILLGSSAGNPELRITWSANPPTVGLLGQTAALQLISGTLTDLGGDTWRMAITAENTTAAPVDVLPRFYVTRGVENAGLDVGLYAGALMAGIGHLGTGFVRPGAVPGTNALEGVEPETAVLSPDAPDLRPLPGGPLESGGAPVAGEDIYARIRTAPDTIGAASLNPGPEAQPADGRLGHRLDPARPIDRDDILSALRDRTVMPASPPRTIGV